MRALLYACATGADFGQTVLDEKLPELRRFAGIKGYEVAGEFTDAIPTGMGKRPGFDALCAAIRAGSGDLVLANSIDDLFWDLGSWLPRLKAMGLGTACGLVCIENSFDATTWAGKVELLRFATLIDEWSRGRHRTRQRVGYLRSLAKADGEPIAGRPRLALNLFEIKALWEKALSQREMQRELARLGRPVSKGYLSKLITRANLAGQLDHAARAAAGEGRGGPPRGGRPKKLEAQA